VTQVAEALTRALGPDRVRPSVSLAPMTTFRVGGPADWFIETRTSDDILTALAAARAVGIAVTILGGGSNVLVADSGVRGLVIRPRGGEVRQIDPSHVRADASITTEEGATPMMAAAGVGIWQLGESAGTNEEVFEAVKICFEQGNDVNAVDANGDTALHGAAHRGSNEIVQFLVEHGAKLDVVNKLGWTPYLIADGVLYPNTYNRRLETAALALDAGVQHQHDGRREHVGLLRAPAEIETGGIVGGDDHQVGAIGEALAALLGVLGDAHREARVTQAEIEDPPRRFIAVDDQNRLRALPLYLLRLHPQVPEYRRLSSSKVLL